MIGERCRFWGDVGQLSACLAGSGGCLPFFGGELQGGFDSQGHFFPSRMCPLGPGSNSDTGNFESAASRGAKIRFRSRERPPTRLPHQIWAVSRRVPQTDPGHDSFRTRCSECLCPDNGCVPQLDPSPCATPIGLMLSERSFPEALAKRTMLKNARELWRRSATHIRGQIIWT